MLMMVVVVVIFVTKKHTHADWRHHDHRHDNHPEFRTEATETIATKNSASISLIRNKNKKEEKKTFDGEIKKEKERKTAEGK